MGIASAPPRTTFNISKMGLGSLAEDLRLDERLRDASCDEDSRLRELELLLRLESYDSLGRSLSEVRGALLTGVSTGRLLESNSLTGLGIRTMPSVDSLRLELLRLARRLLLEDCRS